MLNINGIISAILLVLFFVYVYLIIWTINKGAPYLPSKRKTVQKMLDMAQVKPGDTIYDLGAGDGRVVIMAARKFGATCVGIEIHPLRYFWCQLKITVFGLRRKVKIKLGDFFNHNISDADVIFCYLLQHTNDKLEWKLIKELSDKTRIVSNTFIFHMLQLLRMDAESRIYVYGVGISP